LTSTFASQHQHVVVSVRARIVEASKTGFVRELSLIRAAGSIAASHRRATRSADLVREGRCLKETAQSGLCVCVTRDGRPPAGGSSGRRGFPIVRSAGRAASRSHWYLVNRTTELVTRTIDGTGAWARSVARVTLHVHISATSARRLGQDRAMLKTVSGFAAIACRKRP